MKKEQKKEEVIKIKPELMDILKNLAPKIALKGAKASAARSLS